MKSAYEIENFRLQKMDIGCIPLLLEIQEEAFGVLDDPDLLRRNTYETLAVCFNDKSLVLGAYVNGEIAGFGILYDAGEDSENLAKELDNHDDIGKYVNAKLVIVRPAFRGRGIQRAIIDALVDHARKEGFIGVCATVSPKNNFSSDNLKSCGFVAVKTLIKYGGKTRILYYKDLK